MRKRGFVDIEEMLKEEGIDTTSMETIHDSSKVSSFSTPQSSFLEFNYKNEKYYYKVSEFFTPYSEMIASTLLEDFGIRHVEYDLACLKDTVGLISKNYKKENATYTPGYTLLEDYSGETDKNMLEVYNNIEDIWMAISNRYNNSDITKKVVDQIVDLYIYDILICNSDRSSWNYELEEYNGDVNLAPIYDNERFLISNITSSKPDGMPIYSVYSSLTYFLNISSGEYLDKVKEKLWIIDYDNILKTYKKIEERTGSTIPQDIKEGYLIKFIEHKERIEDIINKCQRKIV